MGVLLLGAGSGGRTRTVSLPPDFESGTSANSIIPARIEAVYPQRKTLYHNRGIKSRVFLKFKGDFT